MEHFENNQFRFIGKNLKEAEELRRPSLSYWKDAYRRLKKHKPAVISCYVLVFLIIMSIIGPFISKAVNGHTYRRQQLDDQNQTTFLSNRRAIKITANDVFLYDKYRRNTQKSKIYFTKVKFKGTGTFTCRIGDADEAIKQGDKKEYILTVEQNEEDWDSFINNINTKAAEILKEDPDFRGFKVVKKGNKIIMETQGETKFNTRYWLGTDEFGRDLFTRLWEGGRISFLIAFLAVFMTVVFGVIYGGISGYMGGMIDVIFMRIIEIIMVVPPMLYIILLLSVLKPGLAPIIIVLGSTSWMGTARIVRGEVMRLKHFDYIMASEKLGASPSRIIFRHLIPNTMGPIIVNTTIMIPRMIFAEAFLSFIGLGVPVPFASWGSLINDGAKIFTQQPNQLFVPAIALSLTMLAFNILGDGLRDALDPRLRK
ncbi:MAG: ABC transporter permease [Spirochaetes bacterium]|nr:ABC transporter permease [Spirochaetota bacterium]